MLLHQRGDNRPWEQIEREMGRALEKEEMSLLGSRDEIFLEAVRLREEEMLLCLRQMPYN